MAKIHVYLNFNGDCETAFSFYEKVFQSPNLGTYRFRDLPGDSSMELSESDKNKVMHTAISINSNTMLMGSDYIESFGQKVNHGNGTYVMLDVETPQEAKKLYSSLTEGNAQIEMELGAQPWAELYASFQDQFGISWMIHYEGNSKMQ